MKGFIENKILEKAEFQSNSIGPLGYLVHKMSGEGNYTLEVYKNDKALIIGEIICSKEFSSTSENIDLSQINSKNGIVSKYRLNNENGFILLYNSFEFSNDRIVIRKGKSIEFDSKKLKTGDLYALNLIKPGMYEMQSKAFKKNTKIDVAYPNLDISKEARSTASNVISSANFKDLKQNPNQGLVIHFDDTFNEFNLKLLKENLPKKGQTIAEQLKANIAGNLKVRKRGTKSKPIRKFHYEYK